jgi:hypothetical protein
MKLIFEMTTGATVFVTSGAAFTPVPVAHVAGAVVGWAVGMLIREAALCHPDTEQREAEGPGCGWRGAIVGWDRDR